MLGNHKTFLSKSRDAVVILDYADELSVHSMHKGKSKAFVQCRHLNSFL